MYYYDPSNNSTTQTKTAISPPCNFLEQGRTNARVNADCPKIWSFSVEDGKWYYLDDNNDWQVFVLDLSVFDGYTLDDFINYWEDHQVEAEQLYTSIMSDGPYGLLPTSQFILPIFVDKAIKKEIRALEIINARENKQWSRNGIIARAYWNLISGIGHFIIDVAGMAPVIGEAADVVNGFWYTIEGNGTDAALSFASALPVAGWLSTTGKWVGKAIKLSDGSVTFVKLVKRADGLLDFGDRSVLRSVFGYSK